MRFIIIALLITFICPALHSQRGHWDNPMKLRSCSIDIKANQFTATTFVELEFYNPGSQTIEGLYQFELKPEQVITAFQLDLDGKFRDGSIEEKWKATNAYNTIVGKRIDPALLTMDYADHYSLRIFPVPAKGTRKVTFTIDQLLRREEMNMVYALPMLVKDAVNNFKLSIHAKSDQLPTTLPGIIEEKVFNRGEQQHSLNWSTKDIFLRNPISFSIPLQSMTTYCTKRSGQQTSLVMNLNPSFDKDYKVDARQLTVFWDVSQSTSNRNLSKEISFLKEFISTHGVKDMKIVTFNDRIRETAYFNINSNNTWNQFLQKKEYSGATQLGCIDLSDGQSDIYLVFTDGNHTFGKQQKPNTGALVYAVHSTAIANNVALTAMVGTGGGKVIDLSKMNVSDAISVNSKADYWLLKITSATGKTITKASLPHKLSTPIRIVGTMNTWRDTLYFHYGTHNKIKHVERIPIQADNECGDGPVDRVVMLSNFNEIVRNGTWEERLDFGLDEKIVTPNTAYIVLERVEDYITYNIAPPKELKAICEKMNYVKKDSRIKRAELKKADEFELLSQLVVPFNHRIRTWDATATPIVLNRLDFENDRINRSAAEHEVAKSGVTETKALTGNSGFFGEQSMDEVVVVGYSMSKRRDMTGAVSVINGDRLRLSQFNNIEQALQGRVAGLNVVTNNELGNAEKYHVTIRGARSITGNGEPLYVIDGIPVSGNPNNLISMSDIDNITVYKDFQAATLYGSRAANGAIIITSKKGKSFYRSNGRYRLRDMEDVEYLQEIKDAMDHEKKRVYNALQKIHGGEPGFYFDMAQYFFGIGQRDAANDILMNAAEAANGSYQAIKAMAYILESWNDFKGAIEIYRNLLSETPTSLYAYRDLAWALYQDGQMQEAVDTLYAGIARDGVGELYLAGPLKAMMLTELNAILALHKDQIETSKIPSALIKPMPADLRIVLDCNKGSLGELSIKEPGGQVCSYNKPVGKAGSIMNNMYYGYHHGPAEYQSREAMEGKFKISLNYYDYYNYPGRIPTVVRLVTFRNFGKVNQSIKIENVIMDNQYGEVEIGEVKWQKDIF
ncbi:MAG: TonB-dependent receptor plug domain-containing protein [Chitinophagaceae bacterium]|nr:TonB-dependent receptor plug domain-containing protein [Chitinophagaceae bacterium]